METQESEARLKTLLLEDLAKALRAPALASPPPSPLTLAEELSPILGEPWLAAPHLRLIAERVEHTRATGGRLCISAPMRSGKSQFVARWWLLWLAMVTERVGQRIRVIVVAHTQRLAESHVRWIRDAWRTIYGQGALVVDRSDEIVTRRQSSFRAVGARGALVGYGADVLVIDDPVRTPQEATSEHQRDQLYSWAKSAALSRVSPGGCAVVIMSRWHEDDLIGRLLKEERWEYLRIPARADSDDDPLGRAPGEPLVLPWIDDSEAYWAEREKEVGPYAWAAHYQGTPRQPEGSVLVAEWLERSARLVELDGQEYVELDDKRYALSHCRIVSACDPAISTDAAADRAAIVTVARTPGGDFVVLEALAGRWGARKLVEDVLARTQRRWGSEVVIEAVGLGGSLLELAKELGVKARPLKVSLPREWRVQSLVPVAAAGRLFVCSGSQMLELRDEALAYPYGEKDDLLDALCYAVAELSKTARVVGFARRESA